MRERKVPDADDRRLRVAKLHRNERPRRDAERLALARRARVIVAPMTSPLAAPGPWDLVAPAYSAELVPQFELYSREALRLAGLRPSSRIVDVATGPGTLAVLAARAGHTVAALDFAPSMVAALRARVDAEGLGSKIDAREGDGMALPYADASFHGGFSMFGLMFFPDRDKGFRELLRVVKPGAAVVVSSWLPLDRVEFLHAAITALMELVPPPPNAPPYDPPLTTREKCLSEMKQAGVRDVEVHEVTFEMPVMSTTEAWAVMERTTAPIVLRKKHLGERWNDVSKGVLERLLAKFGDAPRTSAMPAFLTVGRR